MSRKIIGVVGSGMIGRDPFDPRCWSRSGCNLFLKLREKGYLHRAFGVEVPHPLRGILMASHFHANRRLWAQRFHLDPNYYRLLTREIRRAYRADDFENGNVALQIGGHYNASRASRGRIPTCSYHDANVGGMMRSRFFPKENLKRARKAFDYEKSVYRDMARIFVMAEYWKRSFIEEFEVPADRVVNIGIGVNVEIPDVQPKDYTRKHVVFIGIDFDRKGGNELVAAWSRVIEKHPDATLHVIGPKEAPEALRRPGLRGVEFHGHLSRENPEQKARLLDIFRKGTLVILPSLYEPFGTSILEGMLYRMPAIATNDWSFPDIVTPATGLLVDDPSNAEEMAEKIGAFLGDPGRSEACGNAGRDLVLGRYTWGAVVERLHTEITRI